MWQTDIPEDLDGALVRAEAYLLSLRRQKNARALIACLPVEILAHIFSFIAASPSSPHTHVSTPPPWLAVTHVCQRWRHAALTFPRLWSTPLTSNRAWTREMLLRSRSAPIHIIANRDLSTPEVYPKPEALSMALAHVNRAVRIELHTNNVHKSIKPLAQQDTPLLESLAIEERKLRYNLLSEAVLLDWNAPKLSDLIVRRINLVWPCRLIQPNLVHLELAHFRFRHFPTMQELRSALRPLVRLETLILDNALPMQPSDSSVVSIGAAAAGTQRIFLPALKRLKLVASTGIDILGFTIGMQFPVNVDITLSCDDLMPQTKQGASVSALMAATCAFFQMQYAEDGKLRPMTLYKSLRIHDFGGDRSAGWQLCAGRARKDTTDSRTVLYPDAGAFFEPQLTLHLRWRHSGPNRRLAEFALKSICQLVPLQDVDALALDCSLFREGATWLEAFGRRTRVRSVYARGRSVCGLVDALCLPVPDTNLVPDGDLRTLLRETYVTVAAPPDALFPGLASLSIAKVSLDVAVTLPAGAPEDEVPPSTYQRLAHAMERRRGTGLRVVVKKCDMSVQQHAELVEYMGVAALEWDGDNNGYSTLFTTEGVLPSSDEEEEDGENFDGEMLDEM
ncbi:hypothetical protein FA95DRAFT_1606148 [Auriscalpium vulgare]|uniref:Uncharacterized protein n=1 Tax=Auriscalpium vulgare TaxID=40419 RepID=A0ACB8RTN7_9AGAM|nr:hypothetical protein FA95DRAFT_1606148 [Auriscalpium vulgare]